jgi:uncharacterized protein YaaQ
MKLIVAIVGEDDADQVVEALVEQEFRTTRINTAGGFFKKGNATLLIGVEEDRAGSALEILSARTRSATTFVLPVDRYERL